MSKQGRFFVSLNQISLLSCARVAAGQRRPKPWPDSRRIAHDASALLLDPSEPQRALKEGKVTRAIRVTTAPSLDGKLDDEAWIVAPAATDLIQRDPDNGQPMTRPTRMQFAYDDRSLYVAVMCVDDWATFGDRPGPPRRTAADRRVHDLLDPRHITRRVLRFKRTRPGWQGDFSTTDDDRNDRDYNGVWEVRTAVTEPGGLRSSASPSPRFVSPHCRSPDRYGASTRSGRSGAVTKWGRGCRNPEASAARCLVRAPRVQSADCPPRRLELAPYVAGDNASADLSQEEGWPLVRISVSASAQAQRCQRR